MTCSYELFVRAREQADLERVAGVKLKGPDKDKRGECPLCGGPKGTQRFSVNLTKRVWHCHVCDIGGDAIELEQRLRGGSAREAAERLLGGVVAPEAPHVRQERERRQAAREAQAARTEAFKAQRAMDLWRTAGASAWGLVETYLRARGCYGPWLDAALEQLRFAPAAHHSGNGPQAIGAPAMVGLRMAPAGPTGGVHITYLHANGRRKAKLDPAKRMLGAGDRDGVPGAVWLTRPDAAGPLVVGEGIESTISAAILLGVWPCRMVATLSLEALQGGWLEDKWGRVNVDAPTSDLERKAFTWPEPDAGWGEVIIAVDRDMAPLRRKVRKATGGTYQRLLSAEDRARVCGALAQQQWRAAGAKRVRVIAPAPGRDFNDELMASRARQTPRFEGAF